MSKAWSEFYKFVLPEVPGCTPARADIAISNAAIEFIRRAQVWRQELDAVDTVAEQADYEFAVPEGALINRVIWAKVDGDQVDIVVDGTPEDEREGLMPINRREFRLYPTPDAEDADLEVVVYVALHPVQAAADIDDDLFEDYAREISYGALAELLASPSKPYSNGALALDYRDKFEAAIEKRKTEAELGHVDNTARSGTNALPPVI